MHMSVGVAAAAIAGIAIAYAIPSGFFGSIYAAATSALDPQSYVVKMAFHSGSAFSPIPTLTPMKTATTSAKTTTSLTTTLHPPISTTTESATTTTFSKTSSATPTRSTTTNVFKTASLIHQKINAERTSHGLQALSWDPALAKIAAGHSTDMAVRNYFSHNDLEGHRFTFRYAAAGYVCQGSSGENIYWQGSSRPVSEEALASKAVDAWMNSPGHRQNILNTQFHLEGIGVAFDSSSDFKNSFYITQDFCTQRG